MAETVFLYNPELERHRWPPECPFRPERARRARQIAAKMGLLASAQVAELVPPAAGRDELERFHTPEYLQVLGRADAGEFAEEWLEMGLGRDDTPVFAGMLAHSALACGASLQGAKLLLEGRARAVFNPAGGFHHARAGRAAGFCFLNDLVLACLLLADAGRRVAYIDIDAHHGDGVQEAFYDDPRVLTVSLHESGRTLYPGTGFSDEIGAGAGRGYCVNLPLPAGTHNQAYLRAFEQGCLPLLDAFAPEFIVLQAGMDALHGDPLAHLSLTNGAQARVVRLLLERERPLLMTGGGGYDVEATARGWARAWAVLAGLEEEEDASIGLGGVLLESAEHLAGLQDRQIETPADVRRAVDNQVDQLLADLRRQLFARHGLDPHL